MKCLRRVLSIVPVGVTKPLIAEYTKGKYQRHYAHQIKAVTSCSTHKIDQQETDG